MSESFDDIAENFEYLDDWEDRYRYVIELGRAMSPLDDSLRIPATMVEGCASQVWLVPRVEGEGEAARFFFDGDSDAMIVKGLIAILRTYYCGRRLNEISELDAPGALARLGLDQHLSSQRSNGLRSMIGRIRLFGSECAVSGVG
ncbi:MAG: SufE family protein [Paracoccaceae bacterium]|nr:SufE family protein [Paracoccaceae bacterium]MDE2911801.1 SufE family protein [Paracoccaceae bacterium]